MRIPGLVKKEVVSHFRRVDASVWTTLSSAALTVLGAAIIAALIGYVTYTVDAKMLEAASSSAPYLIALFLFIFAAFNCVDGALRARRTFYSESDREIVNPLPYKPYEIVLSKTIFLWLYQIAEGALLSLPVLLVFGINRDYGAGYYVVSVIYCLVIPTMVTGASLILSVVFQWVYRWMRGHDLIQFLLAAVVVVGLCFIYALFLRLFLASLSQESDISGALPGAFMENLEHITSFMPPVYHFIDLWISGAHQFVNIMVLLLCGLALPAGGYFLSLWYFRVWDRGLGSRIKARRNRTYPAFTNLLRKELILLFKDSPSIFSYTSLLIMMPFLGYVVISAFNAILGANMSVVLNYYPLLTEIIDVALVLLFVSIINSSASLSLTREGRALAVYKTLPVSPWMTIASKISVPSALSAFSLIVTLAVLGGLGELSGASIGVCLGGGLLLVLAQNFLGIELDVYDRGYGRVRLSFLASICSILVPLIAGLGGFLGIFLGWSNPLIFAFIFLILAVFAAIPLILTCRLRRLFVNMEAM